MLRMVRGIRIGVVVCALGGCTGLVPESTPGGDGPSSSLSTGGIAVDPRTETALVLRRPASMPANGDGGAGVPGGPVFAIDPDTGATRQVADLTGYAEIRVLFPRNSVLVLGEEEGSGDRLMRFDDTTLTQTNAVSTTARYWGTRTSPTGAYVAVADNSVAPPPLHVIEADTLATHVLAANGTSLEAMWLRGSDTLVGVFFPSLVNTLGQARIVSWSVPALQAAGFPTSPDGIWASSTLDLTVPERRVRRRVLVHVDRRQPGRPPRRHSGDPPGARQHEHDARAPRDGHDDGSHPHRRRRLRSRGLHPRWLDDRLVSLRVQRHGQGSPARA